MLQYSVPCTPKSLFLPYQYQKGQQRDHMKNEDMYLDARKPVGREFNTFLDHKNIINNRYEDTNTLVKFEDTPSALYREPNHEDTKDVVYYSDYYEDGIYRFSSYFLH